MSDKRVSKKMSISFSSILGTYTMVSACVSFLGHPDIDPNCVGTGLSDGGPVGSVDAHDVCQYLQISNTDLLPVLFLVEQVHGPIAL